MADQVRQHPGRPSMETGPLQLCRPQRAPDRTWGKPGTSQQGCATEQTRRQPDRRDQPEDEQAHTHQQLPEWDPHRTHP